MFTKKEQASSPKRDNARRAAANNLPALRKLRNR
jgi:hypothetical protein